MDSQCFDKSTPTFIGKLRANWSQTEYVLYSSGDNPRKRKSFVRGGDTPKFGPDGDVREELLALRYLKEASGPTVRGQNYYPGVGSSKGPGFSAGYIL